MKIFLSSLENGRVCFYTGEDLARYIVRKGVKLKWNLMSYFYCRNKKELAEFIRDNSEEILIDSGAHSFQKGKKVDFDKYTKEYAQFIKEFDRPNVIGYFEMDVDNVLGYDKVLQLRQELEKVSDKIIPVWHNNRGIDEFKKMCQQYSGKIVAITGFRGEEIKDEQFPMFLKYAHKYNCRLHCLGMTRKPVLDKVPFDYVDSSSWGMEGVYGKVGKNKVTRDFSSTRREDIHTQNYILAQKMQKQYYEKWRKVSND